MKSIIQFRVSKGDKRYIAECLDLPIVTEADTLDQLSQNIQEALTLHMEGEDISNDFTASPSVLVSFELPVHAHA